MAHYSNFLILTARNDSLDGANFFIQNPTVLAMLGLVSLVALISIIKQVLLLFKNANDDKYVQQAKKNIGVILIAFALVLLIPFLLSKTPMFLTQRKSVTRTYITTDENGRINGTETETNYYDDANSWQFMK